MTPNARSSTLLARLARPGVVAGLLVALSIVLYLPTLDFGLTYDDHMLVSSGQAISEWSAADWVRPSRWVRTATLALDRQVFGKPPGGYHVQNVLWHAAVVLLAFLYAKRVTSSIVVATVAGLLFAVHPVHVEAVANISNRKESLCLFFVLASLLSWDRYLAHRRAVMLVSTVGCAYLAVQSKEIAILLPAALAMHELAFVDPDRRLLTRRPRLALGTGVVLAAAAVAALAATGRFESVDRLATLGGYEGDPTWGRLVLTSGRAFATYLGLLVAPVSLSPDRVVPLADVPPSIGSLLPFVTLIATAAAAIALRRQPAAWFGIAWFLLFFVPVSNWIPGSYVVAERYLYVPSFGAFLLVGWWVARAAASSELRLRVAVALALAFSLFAIARTSAYLGVWRNDRTLWTHVLHDDPSSAKALTSLGTWHSRRGEYEEASAWFERAVAAHPDFFHAWYNLGNARLSRGRFAEAIEAFDRAVELRPDFAPARVNRATALLRRGRTDEALRDYDAAVSIDPTLLEARLNRGLVLHRLGRFEAAVPDLEHALREDPSNAHAARALEDARRRIAEADEKSPDGGKD